MGRALEESPESVAVRGSLLALELAPPAGRHEQPRLSHLRTAAEALRDGLAGDRESLRRGSEQLAGWGPGLTPAGDDYLCGTMLRARLDHPAGETLCQVVAEAAAPRTTTLSAAWLRAAANGECTAAWHRLLGALVGRGVLEAALLSVLAHGATSGADTLAGFLALNRVH